MHLHPSSPAESLPDWRLSQPRRWMTAHIDAKRRVSNMVSAAILRSRAALLALRATR
jgi:hypothetical protein